ncbi:1,6-anhydro-N-acetylmuramyl-L-alanine amidase AmpD [Agarivorans sp. Alg241-V36]|uniref:1,6-anhydro-N-acetylmuramyl-L-alanine amidase AmpD n=1 Tax=Agarivorans sp. Alg241-V36 TaxID=2305992 RepID=UPI0013D889A6|nr:1,6-anhydro-N-acetylmuramyl-L-alanine amidase AmpD [Agarivorans sp. Alg241-V36]
MQIKQHRLTGVKWLGSQFYNQRPNDEISLLVIHCISLPEGCYGLPHIDELFCGKLDCSADPSFNDLQGLEVSAHLLIERDGGVTQYVDFDKRAWHAGVSGFEGRKGCNDFAIGIELEGTDYSEYTEQQYQSLIKVSQLLLRHYPKLTKQRIVAHSDIAPGRKTDPGDHFDWSSYLKAL